jgi:prepilin-type N-terminal cleavage/methylation domain-containing protein
MQKRAHLNRLGKQTGLTLLELIVGLAILGMMAVIAFQGLNLGIRAWERGESIVESAHNQMLDWQLIARQIRSAYPVKGVQNTTYFQGDKDKLSFVSAYSLKSADQAGLVRVIYMVDRERSSDETHLLVYEEPYLDAEKLEEDVKTEEFLEIGSTAGSVSFSFGKASLTEQEDTSPSPSEDKASGSAKSDTATQQRAKNDSGDQKKASKKAQESTTDDWKRSWGNEDQGMPGKVRIVVSLRDVSSDDDEMELVFPIMVNKEDEK